MALSSVVQKITPILNKLKRKRGASDYSAEHTVLESSPMSEDAAVSAGSKFNIRLPWLSGKSVTEQLKLLAIVSGVLILITASLIFWELRRTTQGSAFVSAATQLGTQSQVLAKGAQLAVTGGRGGFTELKDSRDRFSQLLAAITDGGDVDGITVPRTPGSAQGPLKAMTKTWNSVNKEASSLANQQITVTTLRCSIMQSRWLR